MSISTVTSEALQLKLRQLLPSQQGFGTDLSASDTIIPIIDLTEAAEGSDVPEFLQTALAFGSQTVFSARNATDVIANTAGFYRIVGSASMRSSSGANVSAVLQMSDGLSTKNVYALTIVNGSTDVSLSENFDLTVFLDTGDSISAISDSADCFIDGSSRQVADINGVLVNPSGFTPQ
jgi:hypothetical protein